MVSFSSFSYISHLCSANVSGNHCYYKSGFFTWVCVLNFKDLGIIVRYFFSYICNRSLGLKPVDFALPRRT